MFGLLRPRKARTADTAKERLQILLAHERSSGQGSGIDMAALQKEIIEVIRRHVAVEGDAVDIRMESEDDRSALEINIELPQDAKKDAKTRA